MRHRTALASIALAATVALTACGTSQSAVAGLPNIVVWTTYGTGTSTYADLASVANAVTSNDGANIRIVTSDTAIGRMIPLREDKAHMARTGDEYMFAFEAEHEFASEDWGPQDVQVVWTPVAPHGLLVRDDSGIDSFADLRGKNFPRITANPSVNGKLTAYLAYGGLTWADVNPVDIGYGDQAAALQAGQLDVLFQQVYGSSLYELESAFAVRWLSMDDRSPERIDEVQRIAPSVEIDEFSGAPGQQDGETDWGMVYTVPVVTYADADQRMVAETINAIHRNYRSYRDATATTEDWSFERIQKAPKTVPFHPALVRFLRERGEWTAEAEERNRELTERGEQLRAGWQRFIAQTEPADIAREWPKWKERNLPAN
ncbi:hypothetical protein EV191_101971 [Tamaricihabitans halophyticus]|uniref:TRAP transporter TAXI family solute receptor n=1 Tax=Tamaricihabitans halophyticus TaxID=1262583 RepID=A0A4R2R5F3_9PSEU|nr:TAXI family TRAP transporter solute-binding subunit [Tamaricihabitans halophyticus]TCP57019.1 hypothetical protein EV191_101971 [Tamaricihabitans halophyticus]